jgi:carbonic anhydrase
MKRQFNVLLVLLTAAALAACSGPQEKQQPAPNDQLDEASASKTEEMGEFEANVPPSPAAPWGYGEDNGPAEWAALSTEFAMCELGKNQSPVDIIGALQTEELADPSLAYQEGPSELVHKGFALQADYPSGNQMTVGGESYELLQMHFHAPGEHTIAGEEFPLEAHFVHSNEQGNLAVLALMFEEGQANAQLDNLLKDPPTEKGEKVSLEGADFDAVEMLPSPMPHYRYNGSLTTPPCTEGVRFFILSDAVSASAEQISTIREAVGHPNARPVQPINARVIVR